MAKQRVTLATIAEICNVNVGTVSRVLNNRLGPDFSVTPQSREKIQETARRLRYRPNLAARALSRNQSRIITILREAPRHFKLLNGIYDTVTNQTLNFFRTKEIMVTTVYVDPDSNAQSLPPWETHGVIMMGNFRADSVIAEVEDLRIPYLYINGQGGPRGVSVLTDDRGGAREAMEHLIGLGHRRIAFYLDRPIKNGHYSYVQRHGQYLDSLASAGLQAHAGHERATEDATAFLQDALAQKVTAVLAYDHFAACRLLTSAFELGLQLPEQLSVVAFNDEFPCETVHPPLTTVGIDSFQMAKAGLEALWAEINDGLVSQADRNIVLKEHLVLRKSTAPPPRQD